MPLPVTDSRDGARFPVRVVPRASRTAVAGMVGEGDHAALKIALHAPPVEGRAHAALIEFLADLLSVRRADVAIAGGEHSRTRTLLVRGRSAAEIRKSVTATQEDEG
ncbi:MAG TPA: DUF167 domain-containing protein [Acidobacteriaceae bacterium]|nr:DUF167 domain-containing protein [Acidobacteriaceae bacterium]